MATQTRAAAMRVSSVQSGTCLRMCVTAKRFRLRDVQYLQKWLSKVQSKRTSVSSVLMRMGDPSWHEAGAGETLPQLGSDLALLHTTESSPEERAQHFRSVADLVRQIGESHLPVVAAFGGPLSGCALGVVAHARHFIATERSRFALTGPAHGYVPESFALYQLARLPQAIGTYLALTGAALGGQELYQLGLASHFSESQALHRLEVNLSRQAIRGGGHLSALIDEVCVMPAVSPLSDGHALFFADQIEECFGGDTLEEVMSALERGKSEWHQQAYTRLAESSPIALQLTFDAIRRAAAARCWTHALIDDAALSAAALELADASAGFSSLEAARKLLCAEGGDDLHDDLAVDDSPAITWSHSSLGSIAVETLQQYAPPS